MPKTDPPVTPDTPDQSVSGDQSEVDQSNVIGHAVTETLSLLRDAVANIHTATTYREESVARQVTQDIADATALIVELRETL